MPTLAVIASTIGGLFRDLQTGETYRTGELTASRHPALTERIHIDKQQPGIYLLSTAGAPDVPLFEVISRRRRHRCLSAQGLSTLPPKG